MKPINSIVNCSSINNGSETPALFLASAPLEISINNGDDLKIAQCEVPARIELDGILNLEDISNTCISVDMHLGSTINMTYNNANYTFTLPENAEIGENNYVTIDNAEKLVTICTTINDLIKNTPKDASFELEKACFLRDYKKLDHGVVEEFLKQNSMVSALDIDNFVAKNYFESDAIAREILESSPFYVLKNCNVLDLICSYLDFDNLEPVKVVTDNNTSDLTGNSDQHDDNAA